jgi:hypothetical protein
MLMPAQINNNVQLPPKNATAPVIDAMVEKIEKIVVNINILLKIKKCVQPKSYARKTQTPIVAKRIVYSAKTKCAK